METYVPGINEMWRNCWENAHTLFHMDGIHPTLHKHVEWLLSGGDKSRVFFPFCGRCVDMKWMYDKGHEVIGIEGVEKPIKEFFEENKISCKVSDVKDGKLKLYQSEDGRIKLYNGNYYDMDLTGEGYFPAVWDRGALEAIPATERHLYVQLMKSLMSSGARCLLEVVERVDSSGPPYFISNEELSKLYGEDCSISLIDSCPDPVSNQHPVKHYNFYSVHRK